MRSALLAQPISAAAALLQSTTVAVPGSNNQSAPDLTTGLTPSTANRPKIKTGHPARGSSKRSRLLTALIQIYQPGAILHARGRFNDICVFGPPQWVFRSIYHGHAMPLF